MRQRKDNGLMELDKQCVKDGGNVLSKAMVLHFLKNRCDDEESTFKNFCNYWGEMSAFISHKRYINLIGQLKKDGLVYKDRFKHGGATYKEAGGNG